MFTLDIKNKYKKTVKVFSAVTIFSIVFNAIYEKFSYGESSVYMRLMFLAPLLLGVTCYGISFLVKSDFLAYRPTFLLWNSAIMIFVSGCLVKGIIEISGRSTSFDIPYWIAGTTFLALGLCVQIFKNKSYNIKNCWY